MHIAGDLPTSWLHAEAPDHDLMTLSDFTIAVVPHERLRDITERFPRLARFYWFSTNVDAAVTRG